MILSLTGTNPHWNSSMQFLIKDLHQDILCLTVFDRDLFSPDGELTIFLLILKNIFPRQNSSGGRRFVWARSLEAARRGEARSRGHSSCWRPSLASSQSSLTFNCFKNLNLNKLCHPRDDWPPLHWAVSPELRFSIVEVSVQDYWSWFF